MAFLLEARPCYVEYSSFGRRNCQDSVKIREPVESFTWKSGTEKRSSNPSIGLWYYSLPISAYMLVLSWFLHAPSQSGEVGRSDALNRCSACNYGHGPGRRRRACSWQRADGLFSTTTRRSAIGHSISFSRNAAAFHENENRS